VGASPYIETFTGRRFQPLAPVVADICIEDIAHALSNQCRFSGHVRHFYSVGEHSVRVSRLIETSLRSMAVPAELVRRRALWGLLHDASEAYLVDLPTPLKSHELIGAGYRAAEKALMAAICDRFGLPTLEPECVHLADEMLLATEVRDLMFARPEHWAAYAHVETLPERIVPWAPKTVEAEFLRRFEELTGSTK
jgi:5'-deoxynucleotidase YfbR-like HD superfamily hydrolase